MTEHSGVLSSLICGKPTVTKLASHGTLTHVGGAMHAGSEVFLT